MKTIIKYIFLVTIMMFVTCCEQTVVDTWDNVDEGQQQATEPFSVKSPVPDKQIDAIDLTVEQKAIVEAGDRFAFTTLSTLWANGEKKSMVYSPISFQYALSMLANGCSGQAAAEISAVLGYDGDLNRLNAFSKSLIEQLPAVDLDVEIALSDALIVDEQYPVQKSYRNTIENNFYSCVENISFTDREYVKSVVNEWCSNNTKGRIPSILDNVSSAAMAYLLNAMYFNGLWSSQYDDSQVLAGEFFYGIDGNEKVDYLCDCLFYRYAEKDGYRVIEKPFGLGKYGFYILLPDEGSSIESLLNAVKGQNWEEICSSLSIREVSLRIPKFDISSSFSLKDHLKALGLTSILDPGIFTGIFDSSASISIGEIIQKSTISVQEAGTEAAAITVVELIDIASGDGQTPDEPVHFWAERPFVFVIAENTSGVVLFNGVFSGH